jgi:hypothetical protein
VTSAPADRGTDRGRRRVIGAANGGTCKGIGKERTKRKADQGAPNTSATSPS